MSGSPQALARAYAACEAMARAHDGQARLTLRLLPPALRPHVAAVTAYVATAEAMAAARSIPAAERLTQLEAWQQRLHAAVVEGSGRGPQGHEDLIVVALAHSIRSLDLPLAWLDDLVSACGQDTMTTRYASWDDVLEYCRRAANPRGRLLLRIAGYRDDALERSSDALSTAVLLARCWQSFGDDWIIGRLYVPRDVTAACRAREMDLDGPFLNDAWQAAIRQCVDRTRAQFDAGRAVCDALPGRLRYERRLTWLIGTRILEQVERAGAAIRSQRPAIAAADLPRLLWRTVRWPSRSSP